MKNTIRKILICSGSMLIGAAVILCIYNMIQDRKANNRSQEVMSELIELIPETKASTSADTMKNPADDLFSRYDIDGRVADVGPTVNINGTDYCGYIFIPTLELKLPVIDEWSYDSLNISPCRFSGSANGKDLIIAAHNFSSHFGHIDELKIGDSLSFYDADGNVFDYEVAELNILDSKDSSGMFYGKSEQWQITLFTCNISGTKRIAVRGCIIDK